MLSIQGLSLLTLLPLLATATDCPGTTYRSLCCHGSLVGSSVALPPASTFPLSPPPPYTASNDYNLPLHSKPLPSDFSFPSNANPSELSSFAAQYESLTTDAAGLTSLSREFASILGAASTDTNIFSILPISAGGVQKRAGISQHVITAGVTCEGSVATLASNTATQTGSGASSTGGSSGSTSSPSPTKPASTASAAQTTSSAASESSAASSSASSASAAASSASSASASSASTGGAPAATAGVVQKLGAVVGAGCVALGFL